MLPVRTAIYAIISLTFISLFFIFLNASTNLSMVPLRSKIPFQVIEDGQKILNHFTLKLTHQGERAFKLEFKALNDNGDVQVVTNAHPTIVDIPEKKIVLFFRFSPTVLVKGSKTIKLQAINSETNEVLSTKEVTLVGPVF